MSYEYAMTRVRDAIEKCGGNHLKAQRAVLQMMEKDQSLLFGLVGPYLHGIVSHAVQQGLKPEKKPMPKRVAMDDFDAPPPGKASQKHIDAINLLASKAKKKKE
jgi:hypothetical protein